MVRNIRAKLKRRPAKSTTTDSISLGYISGPQATLRPRSSFLTPEVKLYFLFGHWSNFAETSHARNASGAESNSFKGHKD